MWDLGGGRLRWENKEDEPERRLTLLAPSGLLTHREGDVAGATTAGDQRPQRGEEEGRATAATTATVVGGTARRKIPSRRFPPSINTATASATTMPGQQLISPTERPSGVGPIPSSVGSNSSGRGSFRWDNSIVEEVAPLTPLALASAPRWSSEPSLYGAENPPNIAPTVKAAGKEEAGIEAARGGGISGKKKWKAVGGAGARPEEGEGGWGEMTGSVSALAAASRKIRRAPIATTKTNNATATAAVAATGVSGRAASGRQAADEIDNVNTTGNKRAITASKLQASIAVTAGGNSSSAAASAATTPAAAARVVKRRPRTLIGVGAASTSGKGSVSTPVGSSKLRGAPPPPRWTPSPPFSPLITAVEVNRVTTTPRSLSPPLGVLPTVSAPPKSTPPEPVPAPVPVAAVLAAPRIVPIPTDGIGQPPLLPSDTSQNRTFSEPSLSVGSDDAAVPAAPHGAGRRRDFSSFRVSKGGGGGGFGDTDTPSSSKRPHPGSGLNAICSSGDRKAGISPPACDTKPPAAKKGKSMSSSGVMMVAGATVATRLSMGEEREREKEVEGKGLGEGSRQENKPNGKQQQQQPQQKIEQHRQVEIELLREEHQQQRKTKQQQQHQQQQHQRKPEGDGALADEGDTARREGAAGSTFTTSSNKNNSKNSSGGKNTRHACSRGSSRSPPATEEDLTTEERSAGHQGSQNAARAVGAGEAWSNNRDSLVSADFCGEEEGTPVPKELRPSGRESDVLCQWSLSSLRKDADVGMFARGAFGEQGFILFVCVCPRVCLCESRSTGIRVKRKHISRRRSVACGCLCRGGGYLTLRACSPRLDYDAPAKQRAARSQL